MRRRYFSHLILALLLWSGHVFSQSIATGGQSLDFGSPLTANPSTTTGGTCVYDDVVTVNGVSYDAVVTIDAMTNALLSNFDATATTNGNTAANFSPAVLWTGPGEISYRIEFIEDGTAASPVAVTLGEIHLTAWDMDAIGVAGKYIESSAFSGYTLGNSSLLTHTPTGTNSGRFSNTTPNSNTVGNSGTSRVNLEYSNSSTLSFAIGSSGSGSTTQMITFGNPSNWFPTTPARTAIPTLTTFGTTTAFFTCSGIPSASQWLFIEARNLTAALVVTAPTGYEVSSSANGTYAGSLSLTPDSTGTIDTSVYISMNGTAPASNPAQIAFSSTGAASVTASLNGTTGGTLTASSFTKTDPTACATENGTISFAITNVPDGSYTVTYKGGSTTATVTSGTASIVNLAEGHYLDIQLIDANGCSSATGNNITLSEPIDFTVTYAPVSVDICDNATATFGLAVSGATPIYIWQQYDGNSWTTIAGATSNTYTSDPLQDTTAYHIVATSAAGCRYTSPESSAYVHPVPEATLSSTAASCPGTADGSVDLTMVTTAIPMTYLWSTGATTEDLANVQSGTYTVNLLDPIGCQGSESITVSDSDGVAPTVFAKNITVQLDSLGQANITAADLDSASSDNCSLTLTIDSTSWGCSDLGPHTVMLVGADSLFTDTAYSIVTIIDTVGPTIECPTDTTVFAAMDTSGIAYSWTAPVLFDACGIDSTYSTAMSGGWFTIGSHEVWTFAEDANGNWDSCAFLITVQDTFAPSFVSCPADTLLFADALNCGANLDWTAPIALDNSDSVSYNHSDTSGTFFFVGIDTVFHYATDPSGNTDTCFFVVTVQDTIAPAWTGTLDTLTVQAGTDTCGIFTDSLTLTPPTIVEACGIDTLYHNADSYYAQGQYDIYWYVTDVHDNMDSILQRLVVEETVKPQLYCPDSTTVYASSDSTWTQVYWTGDSVWDNCGMDTSYFNLDTGSYLQIGVYKVDFYGIDLSGNSDTCSFFLTVADTTAPVITWGMNDTTLIALADSCTATLNWPTPSIEENSSNYTTTYYNTNGTSATFNFGSHVLAYVVTDAAGNKDSVGITVTVIDSSGPLFLVQPAVLTLDAQGFDTLQISDIDTGTYDCNGIDSLWLSQTVFTCADIGTPAVWFYAQDTLGNLDSVALNVTVNTGPNGVVQATTSTTDVLCNGDSTGTATLFTTGGSGSYSYTWTSLDTAASITGLLAGTYFYDVSDTNGCVASGSITIGEPAALSSTITVSSYNGYGVSAEGANDGTIDLTVTGGVAPITYNWNNGYATTEDLSGLPEGTYFVTATDSNGCTVLDTAVLTEPDFFKAIATNLSNNICPDETNGSVFVTLSGGVTPITLSWSNGATTDTLTGLVSGWYTITAVDGNGVLATDSIEVLSEDLDCDGILNIDEGGVPGGGGGLADTDGDGIPNQEDTDSDGDGISDALEFDSNGDGVGFDDCDDDGIPNFLDPDECELKAATVLTPDGDGNNDFWVIPGIAQYPGSHVVIFNRLGIQVYENQDYQNDFDGRANAATYLNNAQEILPTGTYYYYVRMGGTSTTEYNGYLYINR